MIWPRVFLRFKDGRPDQELDCVDPGTVPVKPGEKLGPCLAFPIQAFPLQMDTKPMSGFIYWDGSCWRICPHGPGQQLKFCGGEAIEARGIVALAVLPHIDGVPYAIRVKLYETDAH
jgi:hypothetical protein